jgi:hypothetical protein
MDCTDIKALLSGLVDDEVDTEIRHAAERHLAGCATCRGLIDEAESLDALLQAEFESLTPGPDRIAAMTAAVLAHREPRAYLQQWTTWAGWIAAAAALVLAITIWVADRRAGVRGIADTPVVVNEPTSARSAVYDTGNTLRSLTFDPETSGDGAKSRALTTNDIDTLAFAAWIIEAIENEASPVVLADARDGVVYEGLLPRLGDLRGRLDPGDREIVAAAESLLRHLVDDELDADRIDAWHSSATNLRLRTSLNAIIKRFEDDASL